jgi:hypothetical protein
MTRAELHSLDSYSNVTLGRPIVPTQCACCGKDGDTHNPINYGGLCADCQRKSRPSDEVVILFRPMGKRS